MLAIITSHPIQYQAPLWRALAAAGIKFEVWFLTPHAVAKSYDREFGQSFSWDVDLLSGYPHRFLPIAPDWRLDRFRGIRLTTTWREEFTRRGVTHLWVEGWRFAELWKAVSAAHATGLSVWLRGENHDLAPAPWLRTLLKRVALGWLFRRIDQFLCIGTANERFYRRFGVAPDKIRRAPYCVDNVRFAAAALPLHSERAAIRREWQIADEAFCLLFCGKLIPKKRPGDLITAVRQLAMATTRPFHLLYAGSGEQAESLAATMAEAPRIPGTITGFLNQTAIPRAFAAADCLVLPSDYGETWGLVVNEALASGKPAIISDHCGCAEDLGLAQGSLHVFPCGNTAALARSIAAVMENPPDDERLHKIIDAHSVERTVATVRQLLPPSLVKPSS